MSSISQFLAEIQELLALQVLQAQQDHKAHKAPKESKVSPDPLDPQVQLARQELQDQLDRESLLEELLDNS